MSGLKASGIPYRMKMLESSPDNWATIEEIVNDATLAGVAVKLTSPVFNMICDSAYKEHAERIFSAIGQVPNIVFVHQNVLLGIESDPFDRQRENDLYLGRQREDDTYLFASNFFFPPSKEIRDEVRALLEVNRINVVPYETNAELAVLAATFIEDNHRNLLFRIYVPSGRLYAAEADKLLTLFQDWLTQTGRFRVRRDGYRTAAGQVFEFYGDEHTTNAELSRNFEDFSMFLDECVEAPEAAANTLSASGLDRRSALALVTRYAREARRLQLDLKHEREARILQIRQNMESELLDATSPSLVSELDSIIEESVPGARLLAPLDSAPVASTGHTTTIINQQIIQSVQDLTINNIHGTADLSEEARELLRLIGKFGGDEAGGLESAVHEIEDSDARETDRLGAKQRLKGFLIRLTERAEETAVNALMAYLENKAGL
ncbi:hypothetical protein [Actinomadura montaniterrae]|uniref:Uncharacterized protein n=1 Tax=Actinomadura montaniterrae TaxID=1803903 RepID=A0A6L3VWE3_9ACTN|nr:hypothetical protein [Actinomadura montaniterrae]KAB2381620.1 hypothetical protein F9B16_15455 [Actinomadura montaniterrae]